MLEVHFRVALRVGGQQHVAVVLPAFAAEAADLVGQVEHVVDALGRVVVPGGEDQQVRALGDLGLVPRDRLDAGAHGRVGDDEDLVGLQAAGRGRQAGGFEDALDLVLRHGLGRVHLLGGVAPVQAVDQLGRGGGDGGVRDGLVHARTVGGCPFLCLAPQFLTTFSAIVDAGCCSAAPAGLR